MQIKDFKAKDQVQFKGIIRNAKICTAKNGKDYLDLTIGDATKTINGKKWDATEKDKQELVDRAIVNIQGVVDEYNGQLQLNFRSIQVTDGQEDEFIQWAPVDKEVIRQAIEKFVSGIKNPGWKTVCQELLKKHDNFWSYPAALKVHHAYGGGLAYHTYSMLRLGRGMGQLYPFLDIELLCVGILLHDLGKSLEMPGHFGNDYTLAGEMLGHIALILEEVVEICVKQGIDHRAEDMLMLKHVIAAHHGKLEWGSIAEARIPEAAMIHLIDKMDATMEQFRAIYEDLPEGQWTPDKKFFLENKRIYKPKY